MRSATADCVFTPRCFLLDDYIVIQRVRRVAGVIIVVADQRECHAVSTFARQAVRHLHPRPVVGAGSGQKRSRGIGRVVLQRRRSPVIRHRVWTADLVPKRQRCCC